jgi:parallel beta-helix repeat protein
MEKTKKPFLIAIGGIIALSMLALMPAPALAETISVQAGGSIQVAIDDAQQGDTVLVAPGTYEENIQMMFEVTVQGSGAGETIIKGSGNGYAVEVASNSTISGFTITGGNYGIYNSSGSPTITNNIITGNNYGISNASNSSPTITNNIITANEYSGISNGSNSSPTITNNIITGNGWYGIYSPGASPVIEHNDVFGNSITVSGLPPYYPTAPDPLASNISADPMFVDPDNSDYHLQGGSPCIDKGTNVPWESVTDPTDAEGNPRIVDGDGDGVETVDMGVFEYQVEAAEADEANTPMEMECFEVNYAKVIDRTRYGAKRDKIEIRGSFKLDDGVTFNPEDDVTVTMTINSEEITIPAGLFKEKHFLWLHYCCFRGDTEGVRVNMHLDFNRCRWWVKIYGMEASGLVQSDEGATVNVELTIGENVGHDSFELIKRWKGRRMGFARFIEWPPIRCCGRWWWWR